MYNHWGSTSIYRQLSYPFRSLICYPGKCVKVKYYFRTLWQRYLEICSANESLHGYTWQELASNLAAIELKNIYGLNPLAKEFIPRGKIFFGAF